MSKQITRTKGKKVSVLVFDGNTGKYKQTKKGVYTLNPLKKIDCISIVDARAVLRIYLKPTQIPSYDRCREIVNKDGYLSVMNFSGQKYILG